MNVVFLTLILALAVETPAPSPSPLPVTSAAAAQSKRPRTPPPPPVLEGVVKGPDGKPIEKARVIVRPSGRFDARILSARSDAKGAFRIELKRSAAVDVRVEAPGLAPRTLNDVRPGVPLAVVLDRGTYVEGVVREAATGRAVPGARVEASPSENIVWILPWETELNEPHAESDAKGRFRVEGLASQPYFLSAHARGVGSSQSRKARPRETLELFLFPGGVLSGTVADSAGRPVADALVVADASPVGGFAEPRTSDARGRFEISGLRPGLYTVTIRHRAHGVGLLRDVLVPADGDAAADVRLAGSGMVRGRLLSPTGAAIAGKVRMQELDGRQTPLSLEEALSTETADGRFTLDHVPPGSHVLGVMAPGFASLRLDFDMRGRAQDLGDVALETGLSISGRVRDAEGRPIAGAQVSGDSWEMGAPALPADFTTGEDGIFVLAGLEEAKYNVEIRAEGYGNVNRRVVAGTRDVDFVLSPAGAISGGVVDETGAAVEDFRVMAQPEKRDPELWDLPRKDVQAADGRFLLSNVRPGTYVLRIESDGRVTGSASGVVVRAGATTDVGKLRLGRGGTIRGTVVGSDGSPVTGATVRAQTAAEFSTSYGMPPGAVTGMSGEFELRGLEAGRFNLVASHPQLAPGFQEGIDVEPARAPAEARIVMSRGARIEGTARRRDGTPLSGVMVEAMPMIADRHRYTFDFQPVPVAPDGSFGIDRVPAGRVKVVLLEGSANQYSGIQERDAEAREGETTVVDFVASDILVTGRVMRSGGPAAGLQVHVSGGGMARVVFAGPRPGGSAVSGPKRYAGATDADGRYALLLTQPGRAWASANTADGSTIASKEVEVPDADMFVIDFDVGGAKVTGIVTDRETGQGIDQVHIWAQPAQDAQAQGADFATGPDGRFETEVDPGTWRLHIRADGYASERKDVTIEAEGSDLALSLVRGLSLRGRVLDVQGRPVRDVPVGAAAGERSTGLVNDGTQTLGDGTFLLSRLQDRPYTLVSGTEILGYALATGVSPSDQPLTIRLRPPGKVRLHVTHADGTAAVRVFPQVISVDGQEVVFYFGSHATDETGIVEVTTPVGAIGFRVLTEKEKGVATVNVSEDTPASGEIALASVSPTSK